jgi:hypothetical protein
MAVEVGLVLSAIGNAVLADGTEKVDYIFSGCKVILSGYHRLPVEVSLTNDEEALIGTQLLRHHKLVVDFFKCKVELEYNSKLAEMERQLLKTVGEMGGNKRG